MARRALKGSLTVRLPAPALRVLRARAKRSGKSASALVREMLERELARPPETPSLLELTQRWVGAVRSTRIPAGRAAREALETWEPDRRG